MPDRVGQRRVIVDSKVALEPHDGDVRRGPGLGSGYQVRIWWIYFDRHDDEALRLGSNEAFQWGYGRLLVYAGIAAVGVGVELAIVAADADGGTYDLVARMVLGAGLGTVLAALAFIRWTSACRLADPVVAGRLFGRPWSGQSR